MYQLNFQSSPFLSPSINTNLFICIHEQISGWVKKYGAIRKYINEKFLFFFFIHDEFTRVL